VGQYETGLGGPDKTRLGGPVRNWAWWASTKLGLVGQTKLGLMGQYETRLGGPVRNWAQRIYRTLKMILNLRKLKMIFVD